VDRPQAGAVHGHVAGEILAGGGAAARGALELREQDLRRAAVLDQTDQALARDHEAIERRVRGGGGGGGGARGAAGARGGGGAAGAGVRRPERGDHLVELDQRLRGRLAQRLVAERLAQEPDELAL